MAKLKKKVRLSPCPFCGSKATYIFSDGMNWYKGIACRKCGLNIYFFKKGVNVSCDNDLNSLDEKRAIAEAWNRRAEPEPEK